MTVKRTTQEAVEVVSNATAKTRLTSLPVEVVSNATAKVRLTQLAVEVITPNVVGSTPKPIMILIAT